MIISSPRNVSWSWREQGGGIGRRNFRNFRTLSPRDGRAIARHDTFCSGEVAAEAFCLGSEKIWFWSA